MQKAPTTSENIEVNNLKKLREIFPQFVKEGQIDFDALKAFFEKEGVLPDGQEKYGLNWAGKSNAFKLIKTPATGTLVPDEKESKDFDKTENLFIEGDNLEVLKLLQKHYREKIKMVYIDPPYNTGKDFIYKDNFKENVSDYYERTGQSENGIKLTTNPESAGRYHSDWLTMMYPRLFLARNLLREDGVIFISIDDNEVANLRLVMDEIFGEENFICDIVWEKRFTRSNNAKLFASLTEKVLLYRKSDEIEILKDVRSEKNDSIYSNPDNDPRGNWTSVSYVNPALKAQRPNLSYALKNPITRNEVAHETNAWKYSREVYERHARENRLYWGQKGENKYPRLKKFLSEMDGGVVPVDLWHHTETGTTDSASKDLEQLMGGRYFDFPKPVGLIQRMLKITTDRDDNDIILDFFAGSGTTAHAVMDLNAEDAGNRKWICVQLPEATDENSEARKAGFENIAQISRERIRRTAKKITDERHSKLDLESREKPLDLGFKSYTLSKSNYRQWNVLTEDDDPEKLKKQMELFAEKPLVDHYDERSVVYEIIVKEGLDLNSIVIQGEVEGSLKIWTITDCHSEQSEESPRKMIVTFADKLTQEQVDSLGLRENDLFVCLDSALDDTTKVNISRNRNVKVI